MSFILLGILNSQAAAAGGAGAYDLLESEILASSASSVTFTGLDSYTDYKHLQIRLVARTDDVAVRTDCELVFNSDSGSNYARHRLYVLNSAVSVDATTSTTFADAGRIASSIEPDSENYSSSIIDILDFSNTSKNTTIRNLNGYQLDGSTSSTGVGLMSSVYLSTNAITDVELSSSAGGNWVTGSRFSLYGIR